MIARKLNKLEEKRLHIGIGYFVKEYYKKVKRFPYQMHIYKFLAFVDFYSVKERGKPIFGLNYIALKNGPVPPDLYEEMKRVKNIKLYPYYKVIAEDNKKKFAPLENKKLNLDYFAKNELKIIDKVLYILIEESLNTFHYSEASHQKIKAWRKAFAKGQGTPMKYEDEITNEFLKDILDGYLEVEALKRG